MKFFIALAITASTILGASAIPQGHNCPAVCFPTKPVCPPGVKQPPVLQPAGGAASPSSLHPLGSAQLCVLRSRLSALKVMSQAGRRDAGDAASPSSLRILRLPRSKVQNTKRHHFVGLVHSELDYIGHFMWYSQ